MIEEFGYAMPSEVSKRGYVEAAKENLNLWLSTPDEHTRKFLFEMSETMLNIAERLDRSPR